MTFAGQYMQQPAPAEGGIYKTAWFNERHDFAEPYNGFDLIVHSWDTAYKKEQHNDPSALTVWGVKNNKAYLLHMLRKHMDYPELLAQVNAMCSRFPPDVVLIEDKASGQSLIQELRAKKVLPVIAIKPESDKVTRAVASSGFCEAGLIVLPRNTTWLSDFERELFLFPNAAHDDMVDSTSQFVNWWKKQKNTIDYEAIYGY
jgi:predicted phage terminase large subunit-like protein